MEATGYRARGARPRPYDPNVRAQPCAACGATLLLGDSAANVSCEACGAEERVPEVEALVIDRSQRGDDEERLAHLRTQLDHEWLLPASVARFGNVLPSEIPEARAMWVQLRDQLREAYDEQTALALLCVAGEIHAALPGETAEQQLARRALAEASAEVLRGASFRHKMLTNLVIGATRIGELEHAHHWLERFDPNSRELDADSTYRLSFAAIATAERRFQRVVSLLGDSLDSVPTHRSSRAFATVLQANALEKLGELPRAVDLLHARMKARHNALPMMTGIASKLPPAWATCEQSMPLAVERQLGALAGRIPSGLRTLGLLLIALSSAPLIFAAQRWGEASQLHLFAVGGAGIAVGVGLLILSRRRALRIARGCGPVMGRILALRPAGAQYDLDIVVERTGEPAVRATTRQAISERILKMNLVGASFDGFWNPEFPSYLPHMTINVSGEDAQRDPKPSAR